MFNFNKIKKALTPKVDTQVLIAKIHNEFDSSTDRLLKEAKEILSNKVNTNKGEELSKLGFKMAKPAVEAADTIRIKNEQEKNANDIEYYQFWYPNNKFITEKEVERICKKYGLLCGVVGLYIGDVPDKNVSEISSFKLRDEDCDKYICGWYKYVSGNGYGYYLESEGKGEYGYVISGRFGGELRRVNQETKIHYIKPEFKICASVKDFDMKQMSVSDGYKLEENIPDPIVLQPVNGGYLIISKWGLEGQDKSLTNEKMN